MISCLLLCTSAIFQYNFRIISPSNYCTAFELILCLFFFLYVNKPSNLLRIVFWMTLSFGFLFFGVSIIVPLIPLSLVATYLGQKNQIIKLYNFIPGVVSFFIIGLSWYFIQVIINPGLFNYYLFTLPYLTIFKNYNGISFFFFLILPFIATFPWTIIILKVLKQKISLFKEEPVVTYLLSWALFPYVINLFMTSRNSSSLLHSLSPIILLAVPTFHNIYMKKYEDNEKSLKIIKERRETNLILTISTTIIGMIFLIYGYLNFETSRVVSQNMIYIGLAWLFSALIMIAFMIKKLNKSVLVPIVLLTPVFMLFTVQTIIGNESISKNDYISSKFMLLNRINYTIEKYSDEKTDEIENKNITDFIFCGKPLFASYFYTGKNFKLFEISENIDFATPEAINYIIKDENNIKEMILPESRLVMPSNIRDEISKKLNKELSLSAEESDWIVVTMK